jgi:hypothetical protein
MNAPGMMARWPKGPFPERYRFPAVEARLAGGWSDERERALAGLVTAFGLEAVGPEDPWVRLFRVARPEGLELRALRTAATDAGLTAFAWIASARARREAATLTDEPVVGLAPSADLVEAVSAVGVAGPVHGIGMPAIVRFLVTLRSFGRYEIPAMGEDCLELELTPRDEESLGRVAERVLRICPPLARTRSAEDVAADVRTTGLLRMDWA